MSQDIWLSKDREVALTFNDSSSRTCGVKLIVTDQGYGVNLAERTKRSTENTANKEWSVDGKFIVNDTLASLNPFTLELKETKNFHAENDLHSSNSLISQALQEPLIFHNMVIGSISEEIHENHYNEIWAALQGSPEAITKIILRNSDPASGSIAGGKLEQIISFWDKAKWLGGVIFTVWTLIVDTLVTGVILALIFMYFATGFLSAYLPFSRSMPKHELERVVTPRPTLDEYEAIRNRLATPRINALETSSQEFFTAQIPIKANGIHCWALVDTGASFTVASEDMCCLLGIGQLLEPTSHTAVDWIIHVVPRYSLH
uniref:Peptidase A2 domain-containing protein n=1 Tax=Caenorhabditis japonica TaxID=281687 RepID=A0A8R1DWB3_CAEJA